MPTRTAEEIRQDIAVWQEALAKNTSAGGLSETGDAEALLNGQEAMLAGPVAHIVKAASDVGLAVLAPKVPLDIGTAITHFSGNISNLITVATSTDNATTGAAAAKMAATLGSDTLKHSVDAAANLVEGGSKLIHEPSVASAIDFSAKTTEATGDLIKATGGVAPPFIEHATLLKNVVAHGVDAAHQYRQTSDAIAEANTGEASHEAAWTAHSDYIHRKLQALHSELASVQHPNAGGHVMADTGGNAHQAAELAAQHANQASVHEHEAQNAAQQATTHEHEAQAAAQHATTHEHEAQTAAQHATTHEHEAQTAAQHAATHEHEAQTAAQHAATHEHEAQAAAQQAVTQEHGAQQAHDHLIQLLAHAQDLVQQIEALKQHAEAAAAAAQHYAG